MSQVNAFDVLPSLADTTTEYVPSEPVYVPAFVTGSSPPTPLGNVPLKMPTT